MKKAPSLQRGFTSITKEDASLSSNPYISKPYAMNLHHKKDSLAGRGEASLSFASLGNSSIGFSSLFTLVRTVTISIGGFFYARSFNTLYGGLSEGASARRSLGSGLLTSFNSPPVFSSSDGGNNHQGAQL